MSGNRELADSKSIGLFHQFRRVKHAFIALRLIKSLFTAIRYRLGWIGSKSGTLHGALSPSASAAYTREVVEDYLSYGGLTEITGKVAEVGPGDNAGVALVLKSLGAQELDLVDRFFAFRDNAHQAEVYKYLSNTDTAISRLLQGADLWDENTFPGLRRWYGPEAAAEVFFRNHRGYRLIVSRAVLEHCADPLLAIKGMAEALEPGGMMLHKIDLRDHGLFSPPFKELEWLTTPRLVHRWMTSSSGMPNRILVDQYRNLLVDLGMDFKILITGLAGIGEIVPHVSSENVEPGQWEKSISEVRQIKQRLAKDLRAVSEHDLATTGIFLVARKPITH